MYSSNHDQPPCQETQAPCDPAQCLEGGCGPRVPMIVLGITPPPPLPQSSESVTLDLLTYTDLESLRSRKLGGRPGPCPRSAQLNSKRYLILIYSVEFDRWAWGWLRAQAGGRGGKSPGVWGDFTSPAESVGAVSFYGCDCLKSIFPQIGESTNSNTVI